MKFPNCTNKIVGSPPISRGLNNDMQLAVYFCGGPLIDGIVCIEDSQRLKYTYVIHCIASCKLFLQ